MGRPLYQRRSSCLPMQFFGVEICSFRPNRQSDRGHLSCQGETRHGRPHPLLQEGNIEIAQWSWASARGDRCAFEEILQIVIMVVVQASHRDALAVALQFASHIAILAAVVSLDCETAIRPQLSLGTEPVWRLQQGDEQGGTNRTDRRNLAK